MMQISYAGHVLQQCPECHHQSVHFFNDVLMCILCGWENKRSHPVEVVSDVSFDMNGAMELVRAKQAPPNRKQRRRGKKR